MVKCLKILYKNYETMSFYNFYLQDIINHNLFGNYIVAGFFVDKNIKQFSHESWTSPVDLLDQIKTSEVKSVL